MSADEGRAFASRHGCLFAQTSSKLGEGVVPAFQLLSSHVLANQETIEEAKEGLWLNTPVSSKPKRAGCC